MSNASKHGFSEGDLPEILDAYLDDQLSTEDRARFEHALAGNPSLRQSVNQQRRLDQSLRRMFAAPIFPQLLMHRITAQQQGPQQGPQQGLQNGPQNASQNGPQNGQPHDSIKLHDPARPGRLYSSGHFRITAKAAAIIIFFLLSGPLAAWQAWQAYDLSRSHVSKIHPPAPLDLAYNSEVAAGFQSVSACPSDEPASESETLHRVSRARFGETLALQPLPPGVQMVGLNLTNSITQFTVAVLMTVSDKPVVVFVESADRDPGQRLADANSGLHLFKREIGNVVLYEVTPLNKPSVVDLFYKP